MVKLEILFVLANTPPPPFFPLPLPPLLLVHQVTSSQSWLIGVLLGQNPPPMVMVQLPPCLEWPLTPTLTQNRVRDMYTINCKILDKINVQINCALQVLC